MKLAFLLFLSQLAPQPIADPLCLATTVYLEARDQSELGQRAVAEVAMRRYRSARHGNSVCAVVTAPKQFAPTIVKPGFRLTNRKAWDQSVRVALDVYRQWSGPRRPSRTVVPGADSFHAHSIVTPDWAQGKPVATIGDHTFYRVQRL